MTSGAPERLTDPAPLVAPYLARKRKYKTPLYSPVCTPSFVLSDIQNRNNSCKPYCIVSFKMGWQDISKLYHVNPC